MGLPLTADIEFNGDPAFTLTMAPDCSMTLIPLLPRIHLNQKLLVELIDGLVEIRNRFEYEAWSAARKGSAQ